MQTITHKSFGLYYFKLGCLLFWACWFAVAGSTNLFDFMHAVGYLSNDWLFRSGNYNVLADVVKIYHLSPLFLNILFICDFSAQLLSAFLFFLSIIIVISGRPGWAFINSAFAISMALWGVFMVMEEIFIAYPYEHTHAMLFAFELITLLALHFLPDSD